MKAFVLAAGRGERLRPLSDFIPKPLLPLSGKPLIELIIERLFDEGIEEVGINLFYSKEKIEEWLKGFEGQKRVKTFVEERILGTAGALKNAEDFLKEGTFLLHNSDIFSNIELKPLINYHLASGNIATLCVQNFKGLNNLFVEDGLLKGVTKEGNFAYTGISLYEPRFLDLIPFGFSHLPEIWMKAIENGEKIGVFDVTGSLWVDIGKKEGYMKAVFLRLKEEGENLFVHREAKVKEIEFSGFLSIEKNSHVEKAIFKNCIVLGAKIEKGKFEKSIIGPDFLLKIKDEPFLEEEESLLIPSGSDRRFFRIKSSSGTRILMRSPKEDQDFDRFIEYSIFFKTHGLSVPSLFSFSKEERWAVLEDLGDLSLYSWLKIERERREIEEIYRKVLDLALILHDEIYKSLPFCKLLGERIFDKDHFRWESQYFFDWYIKAERRLDVEYKEALEEEFEELARLCDSYRKTVIHRDFQSKNIMIKDLKPFLIDYQGARVGPCGYDIASLLWDPYVRLDEDLRRDLLEYYIGKRRYDFDEQSFRDSLPYLRTQRHMQALGAYAFLSIKKGKVFFRRYMDEALRLLKEDAKLLDHRFSHIKKLIYSL